MTLRTGLAKIQDPSFFFDTTSSCCDLLLSVLSRRLELDQPIDRAVCGRDKLCRRIVCTCQMGQAVAKGFKSVIWVVRVDPEGEQVKCLYAVMACVG